MTAIDLIKDQVADLKHSIKLQLAITGGKPSEEMGMITLKLIDILEDDDVDRAKGELTTMALNMIINLCRVSANHLRSLGGKKANLYAKMIGNTITLEKPKEEFLIILQSLFDDLSKETGYTYPQVKLLDGSPIPSRQGKA